ncbi:hypothetical protein COEREDRAFT_82763 [Coemansia reversa NRRL 1564]|uniref:Large ribosomal subunit protein mL54 n=1 Tax=Coemansia reversa (strain ATCC 12441 / NRRL 1564) TaxID=763665 RepID=A0A2G5B684_COERN|nr:hypothetical protein COEREDRAFT_82763 [Coemansia reversa NRRL 1564]|eukprot:PIA14502.1 hypothetical protein COEREDRAFT_82763 [Coemansia reversa NRRL 1564]
MRSISRGCLLSRRGFTTGSIFQTTEAQAKEGDTTTQPAVEKKSSSPSSVVQGTILKGLNIYKDANDPVAQRDEDYPDWLWTLLDKVPKEKKSEHERQRMDRSQEIKKSNFMRGRK